MVTAYIKSESDVYREGGYRQREGDVCCYVVVVIELQWKEVDLCDEYVVCVMHIVLVWCQVARSRAVGVLDDSC